MKKREAMPGDQNMAIQSFAKNNRRKEGSTSKERVERVERVERQRELERIMHLRESRNPSKGNRDRR